MKNIFKKEEILISDIFSLFFKVLIKCYRIILSSIFVLMVAAIVEFKYTIQEFEAEASVIIDDFKKTPDSNNLSPLIGGNFSFNTGNSEILGPQLFEDVISSTAFLNDLVIEKIPANINGIDSITLEQYFNLPVKESFIDIYLFSKDSKNLVKSPENRIDSKIINNEISSDFLFEQNTPPIVVLSTLRSSAISEMKGRIKFELEDKNAKVTVKMPDPLLSAIVTRLVLGKLVDYVKIYKSKRNLDNLEYLQKEFIEAENNYVKDLNNLSSFRDKNIGSIYQTSQNSEQIFKDNLAISFNIYNQVALKLEQSKITLKEESPIFFILEPISIPSAPSYPNVFRIFLKYLSYSIIFNILVFIFYFIKSFNE